MGPGDRSAVRVQRVQRVRPAFGRLVQRVVVSPLRAMSIKSALRIYLSASFGMMSILLIGRGVSLLSRFAGKGKRRSDT